MSIETLLFLAFFILLPVLERLLRAWRRPAEAAAEAPPRPSRAAGLPPTTVPPVPASAVVRRPPPRALAAPDAGRPARRRTVARDLRGPRTLRRAVMLAAILGPCRAIAPYEGEGASGSAA